MLDRLDTYAKRRGLSYKLGLAASLLARLIDLLLVFACNV